MIPLFVTALVAGYFADADRELAFWSMVGGVDPSITLAVARIETGNVPHDRRDKVISRTGDVGRMQINPAWCARVGVPAGDCEKHLLHRSNNYRLAVYILSRMQGKYGHDDPSRCRCGGRHKGGWVAHYNGGTVVRPGSRGERYGQKVSRYIEEGDHD